MDDWYEDPQWYSSWDYDPSYWEFDAEPVAPPQDEFQLPDFHVGSDGAAAAEETGVSMFNWLDDYDLPELIDQWESDPAYIWNYGEPAFELQPFDVNSGQFETQQQQQQPQPTNQQSPLGKIGSALGSLVKAVFGGPAGPGGAGGGGMSFGGGGSSQSQQQQQQKRIVSQSRLPDGRTLNHWSDGTVTVTGTAATAAASANLETPLALGLGAGLIGLALWLR